MSGNAERIAAIAKAAKAKTDAWIAEMDAKYGNRSKISSAGGLNQSSADADAATLEPSTQEAQHEP